MEEQGFFYRDTWAEVDLDCILANVASVKKLLPQEVEYHCCSKSKCLRSWGCSSGRNVHLKQVQPI